MMNKILILKIFFVLLLCGGKVQAQIDGTLDTSFAIGTGFTDAVMATAVQPDGKILAGGWFKSYKGTLQNHITRLNTDGSIDTSFNIGLGFSGIGNTYVNAITVQTDGKILVGGRFTSYNGTDQNLITRLNVDGSLDTSFDTGSGFNVGSFNSVNSIVVQSDGKILVGGRFLTYNGKYQAAVARINSNGTLDNFSAGFGSGDTLQSIAIQSDGKIILAGSFNYDGNIIKQKDIVRLNTNGTQDTSFETGTGFDGSPSGEMIQSITIQPDGKILVGGWFTTYKGMTQNRIARLNINGNLDTSFAVGTGIEKYSVETIALQRDGKILLGGSFVNINGTSQRCISRLNNNGSIDNSFNIGTGFSGTVGNVKTISIQPDGKILVGGYFATYQGISQNKIARLNGETLSANDMTISKIAFYPNPVKEILNFSEEISNIKITEPSGKIIEQTSVNGTSINVSKLPKGLYFITFGNRYGESTTKKMVKE